MMKKEIWSFKPSDLYTIPNILSYIRILLIVPFVICFFEDNYLMAAFFIGVSGLTDCCDGYIARHFNQVTSLGKLLDPIADKLTLLVVVVCLAIKQPFMFPILVILFAKDLLMLLGGSSLIKKGLTPPAAQWYGKISTIIFYFTVSLIVFAMLTNLQSYLLMNIVTIILLLITAFSMLYALYRYSKIYLKMVRDYKNKKDK